MSKNIIPESWQTLDESAEKGLTNTAIKHIEIFEKEVTKDNYSGFANNALKEMATFMMCNSKNGASDGECIETVIDFFTELLSDYVTDQEAIICAFQYNFYNEIKIGKKPIL